MFEVETLPHQRIEGLEQAFLDREGQGDLQRRLLRIEAGQFAGGEDLSGQAQRALLLQQVFDV
ncbi:hypothetical protein D3C76_1293740 [compost metagenome]